MSPQALDPSAPILDPMLDPRNLMDSLKGMAMEDINALLDANRHPFAVAMEHWQGDYNLGSVIRNANAFLAKESFYIGRRKWDRRGAVGTHHYSHLTHLSSSMELPTDRYVLVGIDNLPGAVSMLTYEWPVNALMVFGEEGEGLTDETRALCRDTVYIPQFGSVRSLNASVASGIAMYSWTQQHGSAPERS